MWPIAEIRKGDDCLTRDAYHFAQDMLSTMHRLQGLRQNYRIELLIVEHGQTVFEVLLNHMHVTLYA